MDRESIESSMINSVGYDAGESTLEIEFNDGEVWQYFDVPRSVWNTFIRSDSKGKTFKREIKYQYAGSKHTVT